MSGGVRFTEEMKGFFLRDAPAFDTGYENGRATGSSLLFHLTIGTADVDAFLDDPDHEATANGWIIAPTLGAGRLPVERGRFNLLVAGRAPGRLAMRYRLWFYDGQSAPRTLVGIKDVGNDAGLDVWKDTTSLATTILEGHATPGGDAEELGRGLLHLTPAMFARQLLTFRGDPIGIARFGSAFALGLLREYAFASARRQLSAP